MILKGCTRCGGDMFPEEDDHQPGFACLQCGNRMAAHLTPKSAEPADTRVRIERHWLAAG